MLFRRKTLEQIVRGEVTLAFRRWRKPQARPGGTQRTAIGILAIDGVEMVDADSLTEADAIASGFPDRLSLFAMLGEKNEGDVYRVRLHFAGLDPREALREEANLSPDDVASLAAKLDRMDKGDAWTRRTLQLIADHPGRRAADLAAMEGLETLAFKQRVRRLKALGLTESLEVGYRISPRGKAVLGTGT